MTESQIERLIAALDRISDQLNMIDERLLDFVELISEMTNTPGEPSEAITRYLRVKDWEQGR